MPRPAPPASGIGGVLEAVAVVLGQYRLAKLITFEQETMLLGAVRRLVAERARAARDLSPTNQDENDVSFHDHST